MGSIGWPEILIVLIIVIVIFGSRRIPELARALGQTIYNFRNSVRGKDHPASPAATDHTRKPSHYDQNHL